MPYDENSFLQGVAVGRSLKGISVASPNGDARIRAVSGVVDAIVPFYSSELALLHDTGGEVAVGSAFFHIDGASIDTSVSTPATLGIGSIVPAAVMTHYPVSPFAQAETPGELNGTVGASGILTIDQ